jgi:hypothetical protein
VPAVRAIIMSQQVTQATPEEKYALGSISIIPYHDARLEDRGI